MQGHIDDVQCDTQTHPKLKKRAPLITQSSSLKVCICSRAVRAEAVLQNGQVKNPERTSKESIYHGAISFYTVFDTRTLDGCSQPLVASLSCVFFSFPWLRFLWGYESNL